MTVTERRPEERTARQKYCRECGAPTGGRFCSQCGTPLTGDATLLRPLDPSVAFVLELVGGLVGFLGVGWLYGGRVGRGLLNLFGWWLAILSLWSVFFALVLSGADLGLLLFLMFVIWIAAPTLSALQVKRHFQPH